MHEQIDAQVHRIILKQKNVSKAQEAMENWAVVRYPLKYSTVHFWALQFRQDADQWKSFREESPGW